MRGCVKGQAVRERATFAAGDAQKRGVELPGGETPTKSSQGKGAPAAPSLGNRQTEASGCKYDEQKGGVDLVQNVDSGRTACWRAGERSDERKWPTGVDQLL